MRVKESIRRGHHDPELRRARAGQREAGMTVLADLEEFVSDHRTHRPWPATRPSPRGTASSARWRARVGWCLSGG
jgi:hypothetical protein